MYALVMWIGDEPTTSVVLWKDIQVSGKKTRAKWGPKYCPVQVLRQSADKDWLEALSVVANGQVIWAKATENNGNAAKKQKLNDDSADVGKKKINSTPLGISENAEQVEKPKIKTLDDSDEDDNKVERDEKRDSDDKTEKYDSDEKNDNDAETEKYKSSDDEGNSDAESSNHDDVRERKKAAKVRNDSSDSSDSEVFVENRETSDCRPECDYFRNMTVTVQALNFMKHLVEHLETDYAEQQRENGKIELVAGSRVWAFKCKGI